MMAKPADYWQKRTEGIISDQFKKSDVYIAKLKREYEKAAQSIQRDIEVFYSRFAETNEISMANARKLLNGKELKEFKMTLEEFINKAKNNADGRWTQQLNNAYFKTRISRLEALQVQLRQQSEMLAAGQQKGVQELLKDVYEDTYYRSLFELQKGTGIGITFARANAEKALSTEWAGSNYSKRIWSNRDKLALELETKLSQSLIRGDSIDRTARDLAERMNVSYTNAARVVRTESSFIANQSTADGYKESGIVKEYEYLATLDSRTSQICQDMDGHTFALNEKDVGINYPPLHPNCRSTAVPFFGDEEDPGKRIARDEDGKTYHVPGDIKYLEWKSKYADLPKPPESVIIKPNNYKRFIKESEVNEWENLVTPLWLKKLTAKEANAITRYTDDTYFDVNRNLRRGGGNDLYDELANEISSAIMKFNLRENVVVYRGLEKNIFGASAPDLPGIVFQEPAFMSTSLLKGQQFLGSVQLEIRVPAGSKGAPINPLSEFRNEEYEFLLDQGTQFKILEANEKDGKLNLIVEVMISGNTTRSD